MHIKRITPRTCLWPLVGSICLTFALSIGLTFRSNHYCYAGTCGEWLFPLQARLHVIVWYSWLSLSVTLLALRAFQPSIRRLLSTPLGPIFPSSEKQLHVSGLMLALWLASLYGILVGIWWVRLRDYFEERGEGLPGNKIVAAVALTGHLADVTMGMVLLPVSRHSALSSFFKLPPAATFTFHMVQAHTLFALVIIHGSLYAAWAAIYNQHREIFRPRLPVLNPTYLYHEVWPGSSSSLGIWRASLIFTGSAASLMMLAMFLTSFPVIRRKHFNLFYFTHLLAILVIIVICLHASTMLYCTVPGLSMWLLDWGMRVFELGEKLDSRLESLGHGWYSLTLPLPRKRLSGCACHSPLAHFYIHHSESSIRETHPFTTITHLATKKRSTPTGEDVINVQFLFRQSVRASPTSSKRSSSLFKTKPQWTSKLASLADAETGDSASRFSNLTTTRSKSQIDLIEVSDPSSNPRVHTTLRLEGPYFTPATPELFKTVICLVAGTGLSGAIAISAAFRANKEKNCEDEKHETHWNRCVVLWTVREKDYLDMTSLSEPQCDGLEVQAHKTGPGHTRLDMNKTLDEICGTNGADTWCYISGPSGFITAAEQACAKIDGLSWFAARWD